MPQSESLKAVPATDSRLSWVGRTHVDSDGVHLGFPGVTLTFRARCSRISIELEATTPECWFDLVVDGARLSPMAASEGESVLEIPEVLNAKVAHEIRLIRRTESWQGVVTVKQILFSGEAELLDPPELPKRKLLFVGDSITAGSGVDKLPPAYPEGGIGNNANRAFGMELGRRLGAQVHLVAYGGRGVTRDWQGLRDEQIITAPTFFERALPDDPASRWDHRSYSPDAVTVCLGTNDFNVGIPDEVDWVGAYYRFVARIRQVHPHAWILLASSPILASADTLKARAKATALQHYLDRVSFRSLEEGDERVEVLPVRGQPGTEKDGHPIAPQHLKIADDLEPVLRARLRW